MKTKYIKLKICSRHNRCQTLTGSDMNSDQITQTFVHLLDFKSTGSELKHCLLKRQHEKETQLTQAIPLGQ